MNENSLKLLNAFLESGENHSGRVGALVLPFFLLGKPENKRHGHGDPLTPVEVRLPAGADLRRTVRTILESCRLPIGGLGEFPTAASPSSGHETSLGRPPFDLGLERFGARIRYQPPPFEFYEDE